MYSYRWPEKTRRTRRADTASLTARFRRGLGNIPEDYRRIEAECNCVAELDRVDVHPALAVDFVDLDEHHSRRYAECALDHRLEYALNGLSDCFIPLTIVDDAVDADGFVLIGIVANDDSPELVHFACGLGLDSAAREVQGSDEWEAGLYKFV